MIGTLRTIHAVMAWVLVVGIAIQVFLAGTAIPQLGGDGSFRTHVDVGYALGIASLAVVVAAIAARAGRRRVVFALGLLGLYVVQMSLPYARGAMPAIAALHPVNALLLFVAAVWYARVAWRGR